MPVKYITYETKELKMQKKIKKLLAISQKVLYNIAC